RPDGKTFWGVFTAIPISDPESDRPDGAVVTFLDITRRKQAEEALRASEERFRAAFSHAAVGMGLSDLNGRFFQVNAAFCTITGYSEQELCGKHFLDITHPEDRDMSVSWWRSFMAGEVPAMVAEKRYLTKSGRVVWVQISVSIVRDAQG